MYSMDKDSNKENPFTPSGDFPIREQFLYRFSALEEACRSGFRRLDERMDRLQSDLHDRHVEMNDRLSTFERETIDQFKVKRARIDATEKRLTDLETWSKVLTARFAVILAVVMAVWTVLAPVIRNAIGIANG